MDRTSSFASILFSVLGHYHHCYDMAMGSKKRAELTREKRVIREAKEEKKKKKVNEKKRITITFHISSVRRTSLANTNSVLDERSTKRELRPWLQPPFLLFFSVFYFTFFFFTTKGCRRVTICLDMHANNSIFIVYESQNKLVRHANLIKIMPRHFSRTILTLVFTNILGVVRFPWTATGTSRELRNGEF